MSFVCELSFPSSNVGVRVLLPHRYFKDASEPNFACDIGLPSEGADNRCSRGGFQHRSSARSCRSRPVGHSPDSPVTIETLASGARADGTGRWMSRGWRPGRSKIGVLRLVLGTYSASASIA